MDIDPKLRFCNTFKMEIAPTAGFILLLIDCINVNQRTRNRMNGSTEMTKCENLTKGKERTKIFQDLDYRKIPHLSFHFKVSY